MVPMLVVLQTAANSNVDVNVGVDVMTYLSVAKRIESWSLHEKKCDTVSSSVDIRAPALP